MGIEPVAEGAAHLPQLITEAMEGVGQESAAVYSNFLSFYTALWMDTLGLS